MILYTSKIFFKVFCLKERNIEMWYNIQKQGKHMGNTNTYFPVSSARQQFHLHPYAWCTGEFGTVMWLNMFTWTSSKNMRKPMQS